MSGPGIGVNASIFSLLDSVYLRPLPVGNADRLVVLSRSGNPLFSYAEYRGLVDRSQSLAGLAASDPEESELSFEGNAALIGAEPVSPDTSARPPVPLSFAETIQGNEFSRYLWPPGRRNLANFLNLFGIVLRFHRP